MELFIYGDVTEGLGQTIRPSLDVPKHEPVSVHINSLGGHVFEGFGIYNQLSDRREHVTAYVEGVAASIASVIACSASRVVMWPQSMLMIHNPSAGCNGNADDHRQTSELLDKVADAIARVYELKTGKSRSVIRGWMDKETWFSAQEAMQHGFCDEIIEIGASTESTPAVALARPVVNLQHRPDMLNELCHLLERFGVAS